MPLRLEIISEQRDDLGENYAREFAACGGTIGRRLDNDWALPDANRYLSGRHGMIDFQAGAYYLVDLSRNGIYINGADTPVGQGNPQRLFDGDQLRFGVFEMKVTITEDARDALDDGMRDSVVRAQLVTEEDESMELLLVDEEQLKEDISAHLEPSDVSGELSALSPALPDEILPSLADANAQAATETLLKAAGINPAALGDLPPEEILNTAGLLLNAFVSGTMDMLRARNKVKERFRVNQTAIQPTGNNPLKFSPAIEDAMTLLFTDRGEAYLSPTAAVEDAVSSVRNHQDALAKAMLHALKDYVERFDPEELRNQFDSNLKRSPILGSANKLKYWELYEDIYQVLTQVDGKQMPELFGEEFARAYEMEVENAKLARNA